ncbi:hypothetical protein E5S69_31500 [Cupriavidus necator]|uniref:packaged DNA stabilization protein n=1 Tax=Cupriavidus necator TaxID=106590 RepID=UPI00149076D3|nr:packaged DNA stabilization protein [Cupriavidus necator]NOV28013.1 hypothetical protein [Cupriavidus necator]
MARFPLTTGAYTARSLIAAAQRQVNLYAEANPSDSPVPFTYYGTPGKAVWSTIPGAGPVRCLYTAMNGVLFGVRGAKVYRYASGWVEAGTLVTTYGPVIASDNGIHAVFVDGTTTAPTVKLSDFTIGQMAGDGWYGAEFVAFVDGRLIFNRPGTQQWYWTGLYALTLDPLDFASAEGVPDELVSLLVDHREIWLFGARSTEKFYSSGGSDSPFARLNGVFIEQGIAAKYSAASINNAIVWLGANDQGGGIVWMSGGGDPQRISTHAMEEELRTYARTDDAFSFVYQQAGHAFYVLSFPTAGKTWAFDAAVGQWHERAYRDSLNNLTRDRANCHAYYGGMNLVGDHEDGRVYKLDLDATSDDGAEILRMKDFPHSVQADGFRMFYQRFRLDAEMAVGNPTEPDPQVWLQWSDDGGHTWSSTLIRSLGKIGEFKRRAEWQRLGSGYDRIWRLATTAKAKIAMQGAWVDAQPGTA